MKPPTARACLVRSLQFNACATPPITRLREIAASTKCKMPTVQHVFNNFRAAEVEYHKTFKIHNRFAYLRSAPRVASVAYGKVLHMQVKLMTSQLVSHQVHCKASPNVVKGLSQSFQASAAVGVNKSRLHVRGEAQCLPSPCVTGAA